MSVRKRNEFLEGDESDGLSDRGYDSEAFEESRGALSGRTAKRRKVADVSDADSVDDLEDDVASSEDVQTLAQEPAETPASDEEEEDEHEPAGLLQRTLPPLKRSTPKEVAAAQKAARRSGVVYISRVAPFMKPSTLKHFLAPHAPKGLGRVFLTPEDYNSHARRVKNGGNKKKSYTDGWVEFASKREAKVAAQMLNGNIVGGKKGNFYHDDIWSMKYLKGFKWSHLTEQIASENAERAARMREEIRKTKEENKAFVQDIERGKMLDGMENKWKGKQKRAIEAGGKVDDVRKGVPKEFKQKSVHRGPAAEQSSDQFTKMQRQRLIF